MKPSFVRENLYTITLSPHWEKALFWLSGVSRSDYSQPPSTLGIAKLN